MLDLAQFVEKFAMLIIAVSQMELEMKAEEVLKVDHEGFLCLSGKDYLKQLRPQQKEKGLTLLGKIITTLGERSAAAQKLKQVITTPSKFYASDQRIYLKVVGSKAMGFVKIGERKLFYHDNMGSIKELTPTCVLDFYVHESCQRNGIGKEIFEKFLRQEGKTAERLAYDRPSEKLMGFLKKHYGLCGFIPQNNNYVIFDRFFKPEKPATLQSPKATGTRPMTEKTSNNKPSKEEIPIKLSQLTCTHSLQQTVSFKATKDQTKSSFGCPWATEEKVTVKATSGAYGSHYRR